MPQDPSASSAGTVADLVADLEQVLGDPLTGDGPFSYAAVVEHEELGELPPGAVALARSWGFPQFLVPESDGGRLRNLEQVFQLTRSLGRRNLTVALMFGSALLGALPVWLWGNEEQRRRVGAGLVSGELACFAVSEPDHGSDLLANEAVAVPTEDGGLLLTGGKWPVGNATRGRFVTVYAQLPGAGQSLLLVDKEQLTPGSWTNRPFVRTVGLRGHDLSGIDFHETAVPAGSLLGRPGTGLVEVLKTLQITRTAIGALSLGSMDAALRIGLRHARDRVLYGAEILRLPVIRKLLLDSCLDLVVAECTALPVARALSVAPSRLSMWSSVVKYLVPVLGEEVIANMGKLLGARSYLREGLASGAFQKIQRDHAVASVFEGTTHVNLHNIASQLGAVAPHADSPARGGAELLGQLFDWSEEAPVWHPDERALRLTNAAQDEITRSWSDSLAELNRIAAQHLDPSEAADLAKVLTDLDSRRTALYTGLRTTPVDPSSLAAQRAAAEHCVFHAAASCMLTWLHNFGPAQPRAGWLILTLERLLQRLDPTAELSEAYLPDLERTMLSLADGPQYFTVRAFLAH